jgi:hypothetical protein
MTMRTLTISFFLMLFFGQGGLAQTDSLGINKIVKTTINYKYFATADNKLFAINDSGQVVIWNLNKLDTIHFSHNDTSFRYTAITKDRQNQIFIGTNKGDIYKVNPTDLSYSLFLDDKYYVHAICFNSDNKMFLIVPAAVYEPSSKKHWNNFTHEKNGMITRKKVLGLFWKTTNKYFDMPQLTSIDNHDRIWMTSSYGEFGGSIQLFDTKKHKELNDKFDGLDMGLLFPKSVFSDDKGNTYITSGLQHFMNWGEIYKIDEHRTVTKIYDCKDYRDTTKNKFEDAGIFVGQGAYNKTDNSIYFATSRGFYKAALQSTGKLQNPQLLFNPTLSWEREPLAIGIGMTIKRMEFTTDNKLIFLTANDGMGIYHNNKLTLLK